MTRRISNLHAMLGMALAVLLVAAPLARADVWNEKTELTITEPVMIPGATLQPGTYIFQLSDSRGNRNLVRIYKKDGMELVTITQAVPIRRTERDGDTILKFNPSETGVPALKGWFYPGQTTGHEFVYSEEQAKQIAERTKTIVLSVDVPETNLEKGTLRVYHPSGTRAEWRADPDTAREWEAWQRERAGRMQESREPATTEERDEPPITEQRDEPADPEEEAEAAAPMVAGIGSGLRVEFDDLEENPAQYIGKTVSVDAEVEEVYGPRLFSIDEPRLGALGGEVLVYAPTLTAALVKDDDRVTITGTLKTMALTEIEREWGWFELDPEIEVEFLNKPVLIAERIVGGNDDVAMSIDITPAGSERTGATRDDAAAAGNTVMDLGLIGQGTPDLVGRRVDLKNVRVLRAAEGGGFFVDAPDAAVLVVPAHGVSVTVAPGDELTLRGAIADAPRDIGQRLNAPSGWNQHIYIIATDISK